VKSLRTMILALTAVLVTAAPAGATTGVLAEAKPWHYWIAPVLFLSFLGVAGLLAIGYYVKVIRLKTRGR